jgi:hypothetical protein
MGQPQDSRWAIIIANAIEANLERCLRGDSDSLSFVADMASEDVRLYDPRNVTDRNLSAAWNFADSYFDAWTHGFSKLDGIDWNDATALLTDVLCRLRDNVGIEDERVLRYA